MKIICWIVLASCLTTSSMAQSSKQTSADSSHEPNYVRLCNDVESMDSGPEGFAYKYEVTLYKAAGIDSTDTEEVMAQKLRAMWDKYKNKCNCQAPPKFLKGSIIKYAIRLGFPQFIEEVIDWNLSLDINDGTGETILQYLEKELKNPANADIQDELNHMKRYLIKGMKAQGMKIQ